MVLVVNNVKYITLKVMIEQIIRGSVSSGSGELILKIAAG